MKEIDTRWFEHIPAGIHKGRNVRDGYARGFGLMYGDLQQEIQQDPLWRECAGLMGNRSVVRTVNAYNLFLIIRFHLSTVQPGHIVEYGCFRGGTAILMAAMAKRLFPGMKVYAFDTFTGLPPVNAAVDFHRAGEFGNVSLSELKGYAAGIGLDNLHFIEGRFENTATDWLTKTIGSVSLCHIDCDLYSSILTCHLATKPFMAKGGYWVLDDATEPSCIGATEAVEEAFIRGDGLHSEQVYPHLVFRSSL